MTRLIPLVSMLLLAGPTQAGPTTDLADLVALPAVVTEAAPLDASMYVKADISFADAMRLLTTLTVPSADARAEGPAAQVILRQLHGVGWVEDQNRTQRTVRPVH